MLRAALGLMLCAGVASAQDVLEEDGGPGYPPKMGNVTGTLGGAPAAWETFDFSIGAFDASAWVDQDYETKAVILRIVGYTPDNPKDFGFRLSAKGSFGPQLRTGAAEAVTVEILQGKDFEGPRLSSVGQTAALVLESIGPAQENSYLRHLTGSVTARLCPVDWPDTPCEDLALRIETDVQMGSVVTVAE